MNGNNFLDTECDISVPIKRKPNGNSKESLGECPNGINTMIEIMREEQTNNFNHLTKHMEDIKGEIGKINTTILDPEKGLYSRLKALEGWKSILVKLGWIIATSSIGYTIMKLFIVK